MPRGIYTRTKPISQATRDRMSASVKKAWTYEKRQEQSEISRNCSIETREKISSAGTGLKRSEEHKRKTSESLKGRRLTDEHRNNISQANMKSWVEGRRTLSPKLGRSVSQGCHNGVWMRCLNSEGVFARQLDEVGIKWIYEPKRFNLGWCVYIPDFYLPEFDIWVEVKGWMDEKCQKKIDSLRETGKTVVVVLQTELKSMVY